MQTEKAGWKRTHKIQEPRLFIMLREEGSRGMTKLENSRRTLPRKRRKCEKSEIKFRLLFQLVELYTFKR